MSVFSTCPDRFHSPSSKYNREFLKDIYGTDDLRPLWVADQDFVCPPPILEHFKEKTEFGVFGYEYRPNSFHAAVEKWFERKYNVAIDPLKVQYSPTIMTSMAMALELFTNPGEGVIIQPPVYMEFKNTVEKSGRTVATNPLVIENERYVMDYLDLEQKASLPYNTAMLLCNPHNPGGRVWSKEELKKVVEICVKYDILLISDEIHADIIYSGHAFNSMLHFEEMYDNLMVCYSPGKVFNIASLSDSMAIIPSDEMRDAFNALRLKYNLGRTNAFARLAMEVGFSKCDQWLSDLLSTLEQNRDTMNHFISFEIPQIKMMIPEGTYLAWLDISSLKMSSKEAIRHFAKYGIGLNPGNDFGENGEGYVRMNFACTPDTINAALVRLQQSV
jgi:cystathionine beta-lyase